MKCNINAGYFPYHIKLVGSNEAHTWDAQLYLVPKAKGGTVTETVHLVPATVLG